MSQEDVIHLLRELDHADIISALSADTMFMGITRIDHSAKTASTSSASFTTADDASACRHTVHENHAHRPFRVAAFDWQERQESMALHTRSQEDVIHLLRELYHADIISALSVDTLFMGITRIDNSA